MMTAAALAKAIRGVRSSPSSQLLLPGMFRHGAQEILLPNLGSTPAMGRPMHTAQRHSSGASGGIGRNLLFGTRGLLSQNPEFRGKRFMSDRRDESFGYGALNVPFVVLTVAYATASYDSFPTKSRTLAKFFKKKE